MGRDREAEWDLLHRLREQDIGRDIRLARFRDVIVSCSANPFDADAYSVDEAKQDANQCFFALALCSATVQEIRMAEREGFEPPIALRLWLISSQLHSTGLCHLSSPDNILP